MLQVTFYLEKCLPHSISSSLCFLNFALKDQCAQGTTISPHLSHWFIFSKAMRVPSFPAGVVGREGVHIHYLSQLFWGPWQWLVPSPPQPLPCSEEELCPALKARTVHLENDLWIHCQLYSAGSGVSASRQPPSRADQRGSWKQMPLFWKGTWLVALELCKRVSFVL